MSGAWWRRAECCCRLLQPFSTWGLEARDLDAWPNLVHDRKTRVLRRVFSTWPGL